MVSDFGLITHGNKIFLHWKGLSACKGCLFNVKEIASFNSFKKLWPLFTLDTARTQFNITRHETDCKCCSKHYKSIISVNIHEYRCLPFLALGRLFFRVHDAHCSHVTSTEHNCHHSLPSQRHFDNTTHAAGKTTLRKHTRHESCIRYVSNLPSP